METSLSEDNNTRAETSGSEKDQLKDVKYEIEEEIPIDQIPSLRAKATTFQRLFFGWCFPLIQIGNQR